MRITNRIMRNNSLYNLNQNKLLEDKLTNQMTNESKIARPSDDPVVAIRALRLRSNVTYVTQYYEKNAEDAEHWLSVTADAIKTIDDILTDLYEKAGSAANKDLTSDDLNIILTQMKSLTEEFYASGNVDYAGRYIFSGYRTDTAITFSAEDEKRMRDEAYSYNIKEDFGYADIDSFDFTDFSGIGAPLADDADGDGIDDTTQQSYEQSVTNSKLYRVRLSYDDIDGKDGEGVPILPQLKDGVGNPLTFQYKDADGNTQTLGLTSFDDPEEAYRAAAKSDPPCVAYIPSTGEIVFSEGVYTESFNDKSKFSVTYDKSTWKEGDINPVHYFECTETRAVGEGKQRKTAYNQDGVTTMPQDIYYDVGFNQKIQVNTTAPEIFSHDVQRDMDDFQRCMDQLQGIETKLSDIEEKMKEFPEDSSAYKDLMKQKEAAEKAQTYIRENIHSQFENQITKYQKYLDANNVASTNNATRGSRLDLISNRLMNQQATFKDLQTDNESIDVTQVAVELTSSEMIYQAALMATGKVMQTNLMNYI